MHYIIADEDMKFFVYWIFGKQNVLLKKRLYALVFRGDLMRNKNRITYIIKKVILIKKKFYKLKCLYVYKNYNLSDPLET